MKKNLLIILSVALALLAVGCKKTTEGVTNVTHYVDIQLLGDNPYVSQLGGDYQEPGFTATYMGQDYSSSVTIDTDLDTSYPGIYSVKYSAVNPDGFSNSVTRDVYVLNPGGIANIYLSRVRNASGSRDYRNIATVVSEYSPGSGIYVIDDLCGGFYYAGVYPGYEPTYNFHAKAYFTLDGDGNMMLVGAEDWYFINSFDYDNFYGTFDPDTCVFEYYFDGLYVTLTPFEL